MIFCKVLRNLIEEQQITQKQLAHNLGIPVSTLGGYVQVTSEPDFETLKLFATYFKVSTDYLLNFNLGTNVVDNEIELLRVFRTLDAKLQNIYIEQRKAFLKYNNN